MSSPYLLKAERHCKREVKGMEDLDPNSSESEHVINLTKTRFSEKLEECCLLPMVVGRIKWNSAYRAPGA